MSADEKAKNMPSARGYAVADASHAMQEAVRMVCLIATRGRDDDLGCGSCTILEMLIDPWQSFL